MNIPSIPTPAAPDICAIPLTSHPIPASISVIGQLFTGPPLSLVLYVLYDLNRYREPRNSIPVCKPPPSDFATVKNPSVVAKDSKSPTFDTLATDVSPKAPIDTREFL